MPRHRESLVSSVVGSAAPVDPQRMVVKGSGCTYIVNSKLADYLASVEAELDTDGLLSEAKMSEIPWSWAVHQQYFRVLPFRNFTEREFFIAAARAVGVTNNFDHVDATMWEPEKVREFVLMRRPDISPEQFAASVVALGTMPGSEKPVVKTLGDYMKVLKRVVAFADTYEPFMEKAFELYKRGLSAVVG